MRELKHSFAPHTFSFLFEKGHARAASRTRLSGLEPWDLFGFSTFAAFCMQRLIACVLACPPGYINVAAAAAAAWPGPVHYQHEQHNCWIHRVNWSLVLLMQGRGRDLLKLNDMASIHKAWL